jgi:hypothetical protein
MAELEKKNEALRKQLEEHEQWMDQRQLHLAKMKEAREKAYRDDATNERGERKDTVAEKKGDGTARCSYEPSTTTDGRGDRTRTATAA